MKVFDSDIGKKIIANKGVQNLVYVLIGTILFVAYELIFLGALNNTLPVFGVFILLDVLSMLKIAWEEFNPEKSKKFIWVWDKIIDYIKLWKRMKTMTK